jgi:hypothetical protein
MFQEESSNEILLRKYIRMRINKIAFGFLSNLIKVKPMVYDDRQEKRFKLMKKQGVSVHNTVVLLNSDTIRKSADQN